MRDRTRAVEVDLRDGYTRGRTFGGTPMRAALAVGVVFLFAFAAPGQPKSDDPSFYFERGAKAYQKGEYEQAIDEFTEAIKLAPKHAEAYVLRATCRMANND